MEPRDKSLRTRQESTEEPSSERLGRFQRTTAARRLRKKQEHNHLQMQVVQRRSAAAVTGPWRSPSWTRGRSEQRPVGAKTGTATQSGQQRSMQWRRRRPP